MTRLSGNLTNRRRLEQAAEILRCPKSGSPVRPLSAGEIEELNRRIRSATLRHVDGTPIEEEIERGYRAVDRDYVYIVQEGIVLMLPGLAVVIAPRDEDTPQSASNAVVEKSSVQKFYDRVGWRRSGGGEFADASLWEDMRPVSRDYIRRCHARITRHIARSGRYLLDAASGPVQYDEYLEYSAGYDARICVDISRRALREARRKLGSHGIYIQGDVTKLPLADGAVDGFVSLHTIYHVPAEKQATAIRELHRTLRPGGSGVLVYAWRTRTVRLASIPYKILKAPFGFVRKLARALQKLTGRQPMATQEKGKSLYFHAHSYRWFREQPWGFPWEVHVWRSLTVPMLRAYIHWFLMGRLLLDCVARLEEKFPRVCGKYGAYPLIVVKKPAAETPARSRAA